MPPTTFEMTAKSPLVVGLKENNPLFREIKGSASLHSNKISPPFYNPKQFFYEKMFFYQTINVQKMGKLPFSDKK